MTKRWRNDGRIDTSGRKDLRAANKQKMDRLEIQFVKQHFASHKGYGVIDDETAAAQTEIRKMFRQAVEIWETSKETDNESSTKGK